MFPGANSDRDDAAYVVVGAPLDVSTSFQPGTRFGPDRLRRYAEPYDDYDHRTKQFFTDLQVYDHGDVHAWDDAADYIEYVTGLLAAIVREESVPILLGGEHTVSLAGVEAVDPDVFVALDAHLDLREAYAGNELSHATVTHHALEVADRAVVLGARAGSEAEWQRAEATDVTVVPPESVPDWDPDFGGETSVYLSIDIDAADPGFAPGTGTTEPFGLTPREMRDVVRTVAPDADGADVVEVNDRDDGQAASLGAKLVREFVYTHAAGRSD